jgi:hypothetical protein
MIETTEAITQIVARVMTELPRGRGATWLAPACRMMELVAMAGDGDHLEIGILHGATVIMAALTKETFGLQGDVIGIDPMQGYYPAGPANPHGVYNERGDFLLTREIDDVSKTPVTEAIFWQNVSHFHVGHRVRLVKAFSYPWPEPLQNAQFVSAYIDGDHYRDGPLHDWENVKDRTSKLVWFDDCNPNCPGVQRACVTAETAAGWHKLEHYLDHLFIVERNHERR